MGLERPCAVPVRETCRSLRPCRAAVVFGGGILVDVCSGCLRCSIQRAGVKKNIFLNIDSKYTPPISLGVGWESRKTLTPVEVAEWLKTSVKNQVDPGSIPPVAKKSTHLGVRNEPPPKPYRK